MKLTTAAAALLSLGLVCGSLNSGDYVARAGNNYAPESKSGYCSKKARKYADGKVGNRTAKGLAGGAVGGALLGGLIGGSGSSMATGALIGGGVGALSGAASSKWNKYYNKYYYQCING